MTRKTRQPASSMVERVEIPVVVGAVLAAQTAGGRMDCVTLTTISIADHGRLVPS